MNGTVFSIALAVGAAVSFGIGMALEHRGANRAPSRRNAHPGLLFDLLRSRHWRWGLIVAAGGYITQAIAFGTGRLVLIEPVMTLALVVALAAGAVIDHRALTRRQWATVLVTTAGVLVFTATTAPDAGRESAPIGTWAPWLAAMGAVTLLVVLVSSHWRPRHRAGGLAAVAGCMYGVTDALTKTVTDGVGHHGIHVLTTWYPYALLVAGAIAFMAQQTAYHASRLADAQPALSVTEPVVGSIIGITVLQEHVHLTTITDFLDSIAVVVMLVGIVTLGRLSDGACAAEPGCPEGEAMGPVAGTAAAGAVVAEIIDDAHRAHRASKQGAPSPTSPTSPPSPTGAPGPPGGMTPGKHRGKHRHA